jgi:Ca2+-transporting ATPase
MVLTDDNFATIVTAVKEGRRINDNIMKAIQFLLSTNVGEIFLLLVTSIFNLGVPLLSIHILWINLVTDSLPALALTMDPAEANIMKRKPNNTSDGFLTKGVVWRILYQGIMIGTLPLIAFIYGKHHGGLALGQTMAFATLCFAQLTQVTNVHSILKSTFSHNPLKNKMLIWAILISLLMALAVLVIPFVREIFQLVELNSDQWKLVILLSLTPIVVVELFKLIGINAVKAEKI